MTLAAFGFAFVAGCGEPAPYDLRRVSLDSRPSELLEAGGVARPGMKLQAGTAGVAIDLAALTAGRVTVFTAPSGDAAYGGGLDVELRETGWRAWMGTGLRERCSIRWGEPGTPVDAPWRPCSFELTRPVGSARLELIRRGPIAGEVFVSEAHIEGEESRHLSNVFILLLDAVRFDGLRPFHAEAGVGENLQALARDSVVLRNLRSSSSWTRPAVATLFTGFRADRHRVLDRGDVLTGEVLTLAEILTKRGYSTAAWSTNPNVLPVWGLAQGFDVFVDQGSHSWSSSKTDGAAVVSRLRAALATRGTAPLFHYAHFMDPHAPYVPSAEQRKTAAALPGIKASFPRPLEIMAVPNDWAAFVNYTGELLDVDDHVGAFVEVLKDAGLYDDALVLVVADHGEEFLDHGGRDHGRTLYEEVLRIPALIKFPGNRLGGKIVEDSLSLVDVLPTLLTALGVNTPPGLDGASIVMDSASEEPPRPSVSSLSLDGVRQSAIFDPPWKLIRNDRLGSRELYNLVGDPQERSNLALQQPDVMARLTSALDLILSHGQEGWHILLCGTIEETAMDIVVRPSSGTANAFGFQEGEAVTSPDQPGLWYLRPTLTPVPVERAVFGKLTKVMAPEQAELLIAPAGTTESSTLEIRTESGSSFDYYVGRSVEQGRATQVILNSGSGDIAIAQGSRVDCATAGKSGVTMPQPTNPFLRVWYVPPVPKVATEALDPEMRERLRALGYLQ